jgi:predicted ATP-grasp superfamily ATP-dependent carboligase
MQVIVTDTHTRMALAAIRELGETGYAVTSVCKEGLHPVGHASRYTKRRVTLPSDGYADALLALGNSGENVLLPTGMDSLSAVSARHSEFSAVFQMMVPPIKALSAAADKPSVAKAARALGLNTPETYPPDAPRFPCVLKYRDGERLGLRAEQRYAILHNPAAYERTRLAMQSRAGTAHGGAGDLFVSEYIPGGAYGVSAVLNRESEPLAVFCHERIREYPVRGGPACCAEAVWHPGMAQAALTLLKALRLQGFAMVEFKGSPERPYVLEVNPRVWGTYPLSKICRAGMAEAYVQGALGKGVPWDGAAVPPGQGLRMQYLVNDLANLASGLRHRTPARGSAIRDLFSTRTKGGVFDWRDLPGTWAYNSGLLRKGRKP